MEPSTLVDSVEEAHSIIKFEPSVCEHCGKEFHPQDSITMRRDGSIKECIHWPEIRQEI